MGDTSSRLITTQRPKGANRSLSAARSGLTPKNIPGRDQALQLLRISAGRRDKHRAYG